MRRNIRILHGAVKRDVRDRVVILLKQQRDVLPELFAVDCQLPVKAVSDYAAVIRDVVSEQRGIQINLFVLLLSRCAVIIILIRRVCLV